MLVYPRDIILEETTGSILCLFLYFQHFSRLSLSNSIEEFFENGVEFVCLTSPLIKIMPTLIGPVHFPALWE